ncbi:MAG TPA: inositol monophosphatase family protein [Egibacteraceae bacterium]|nr:inositol monophosphatase family protein [Egibacteraceae bacterium]
MSADGLLHLAERAARRAGEELLERYGAATGVGTKSSVTDPVSDADRASEKLLVSTIVAERPDDGILGEEGADRPARSGLRWVLDPLDGTVNYLYRFPAWCVSVACEDRVGGAWSAVVGVVHDPLRGETFCAVRGGGARLNGRPLSVNDPVPLERALVATGFGYDAEHRCRQAAIVAGLLPRVRDIRRAGSAALDLCALAAGRVDGYYEDTPSRWDWAAGALLAAEAGAVVGPLLAPDGNPGVLAAGPALADPLRAAVSGNP